MFIELTFSKKLNNGYNLTYTHDTVALSAVRRYKNSIDMVRNYMYTKLRKWASTNIYVQMYTGIS